MKSLRSLKKEEQPLSKPLRLRSYKVKKGDTYKSLAAISSININAEDQLRLINGDYPDKKLEIGRVIKICLLYTSPSPRDAHESRMPSSA